MSRCALSSTLSPSTVLSLKAATTPSREACDALVRTRSSHIKRKPYQKEDASFMAPAPRNAAESRAWNRMSTRMEGFHSHFRHEFTQIYATADKISPDQLPQFLAMAMSLEHQLHGHHSIEEQYIFPVLAQKMPQFQEDHLEEHSTITAGLHKYAAYLLKCRKDNSLYKPDELKRIMSSFGPILFYHLDAEVESLKADNLRKYYTLEQVKLLPM